MQEDEFIVPKSELDVLDKETILDILINSSIISRRRSFQHRQQT